MSSDCILRDMIKVNVYEYNDGLGWIGSIKSWVGLGWVL